jgi:hypothetical protein
MTCSEHGQINVSTGRSLRDEKHTRWGAEAWPKVRVEFMWARARWGASTVGAKTTAFVVGYAVSVPPRVLVESGFALLGVAAP